MAFTPKAWVNGSLTMGKLDAAAMIDLENRLSIYSEKGSLGTGRLGNVIAPHHPHLITASSVFTANDARATRVVVPRDGVINGIAAWIQISSGNVDFGIYDTTSGTANRLWSSGSIACGTVTTWQVGGDPNLTVTAGQHLDFVVACDNAVAAFGRCAAPVSNLIVQLPTNFMISPQGALPKTAWRGVTAFPLPATITEANKTVTGGAIPFIMARLT